MKLLREAMRQTLAHASLRGLYTVLAIIASLIVPAAAFAGEADVKLTFSNSDKLYLYISLGIGILTIIGAFMLRSAVLKRSPGSEKMQSVGQAIREGALAYLTQQIRLMVVFVVILGIGLYFLTNNVLVPVAFVAGVAASYFAGFMGMLTAVDGNMRTAHAALTSYKRSLETAFQSGAVAGLFTVGMGLLGATIILLVGGDHAMTLLVGFGFGGSLAALFMRVGGGIFTKAADVGADLVGKVEAGIPEDDPRNPATIADNVGDNVGDCAGMAADVFESYEVTLVAAIVLGAATASIFDQTTWMKLIIFALMARGVGIVASVIGIFSVKGTDDIDADPLKKIRTGFYASAGVAGIATLVLAYFMMGGTGSPIKTSKLESIEAVRLPSYEKIRSIRDKILADDKEGKLTQFPIEQMQKDSEIVAMGLDKQDGVQAIQTALSADTSVTITPKPIEGFKPVDFADPNDVVANYTTVIPAAKPGDKPKFVSLKDAYSKEQLQYFRLSVTQKNATAPAAPDTREVYAGPMTESVLDAQIKGAESLKIEKIHSYPVSLFYNSEKKEILAAVSDDSNKPLNSLTIPAPQLMVWKEDASTLDKAYNSATPDPNAPRPLSSVKLAVNTSQVVPWYMFFAAIAFGLIMAFIIEWLTDYYVSTHKKPVQEVAGVSNAGPAPMIIQGFAYAAESSVFMVFGIVLALIAPLFFFPPATYGTYILSFYGVALVGLGLLTTTGYVLAMDTFGPISDNAQGVYEMSGEGHDNEYGSKAVQRLDAAGNTTKALTKGFAIATAVVAAVALFHSYLEDAKLGTLGLRLDLPEIFLGLLIGGAAPYLFSASTINAVGRASFQLINEVRRQFRRDPGIMAGTSKPDYASCVSIVTAAAQKELLGPGILAIALPVAVAFGFSIGKPQVAINGEMYNLTGAQALGGFLAGAILSGQLMAVLLANSGGMWDNAKKLIEDGLYGGKGSEAHKAGVVCDTVGDPFKDTAGPALNPLIKVMNLVALLLAPFVIKPLGNPALIGITVGAIILLAIAIFISKKGSLSEEMQKVAAEEGDAHPSPAHAVIEPSKPTQRITVDDDEPVSEETH